MTEHAVGAPVDASTDDVIARLSLLVESAGRLLATLDLDELLPHVLELASRTLDADGYALWRHDSAGEWRLEATAGLSQDYVESSQRAVQGNQSSVALDAPLVVNDIAGTEWLTPEHRDAHAREGNSAFLAMPLRHHDELIGTLVFYFRTAREFSPLDLRSAEAIASLASAAIGTATVYVRQARLAEDRRLIAEASELLASSLDYEQTLANVARLVVPSFADWCAIDMVTADGGIERLAVAHVDPEKVQLAHELAERLPIDPNAEQGTPRAIREQQPELIPEITDQMLVEALRDTPDVLSAIRELGLRSLMTVPLVARGVSLGAITFASAESGRRYGDVDLASAIDLARRAAVAVDNARLFRAALEREEQVRFLADAGTVLARSLDYDETLSNLARLVVPELADWCIVDVVEGATIRRVAVAADDPAQQAALETLRERYPPTWDSPQPAARALRDGAPVLIDLFEDGQLEATVVDEEHLELMRTLDPNSAVALPLVARGETVGAMTFAWSQSARRYAPGDTRLMEDLAARAALAVDNARLFRAERSAGEQLRFLAEASTALAGSLDVDRTLENVAELVVPRFADWCAIDVLDEDGALRRLAVVHKDPAKLEWAIRSRDDVPPTVGEPEGAGRVVRTGEAVLYRTITPEFVAATAASPEQREVLDRLGMASAMVVPMRGGGRIVGAVMLVSADPARLYEDDDLTFAEHIARRAAVAVDNALLYRRAEQRAQAAAALAFVADGVFLVDGDGVVRIWNTAASVLIGRAEADVVGRPAGDVIPGWEAIEAHVPRALGPGIPTAETVPVEIDGAERWLSISGVSFPGGTVYAFRDLTDERRVERLKSEFVSTVSHELRTPLAAIYGAALTLRRSEPALEAQREGLLDVVASESERLARIVNDILWASRLESGTLHVSVESCNADELARSVVDASKAHLPQNLTLSLELADDLPPIAADPDKVRQVLTNLVDNAVKYSPDGGPVAVSVAHDGDAVTFAVRDSGLGIPAAEQRHIFEKFYRLDPELTRGVGGTGLGLYITRELVRRMNGRVHVESDPGEGSTFTVELPIAR